MSHWSAWETIENGKLPKGSFNHLGIYQIRAVTSDGGPIPIHRLVGVDPLGVLYIGRSGYNPDRSIANRIGEFIRGKNHSGGKTYARAKHVLDKFPQCSGHSLQARAMRIETKEEINKAESRELCEYHEKYAELPPFNSARSNAGKDN